MRPAAIQTWAEWGRARSPDLPLLHPQVSAISLSGCQSSLVPILPSSPPSSPVSPLTCSQVCTQARSTVVIPRNASRQGSNPFTPDNPQP